METPKIFESEYRFCLILWEHEPIKSAELARLCKEKLGWSKTTTYTVPALPDQTNNHKLAHVENTLTTQLQNAEGTAQGAITFIEGNVINITSTNNEAGSDYTINHADVAHTKTEITEANSLNHNTEFTVVTDMTVND